MQGEDYPLISLYRDVPTCQELKYPRNCSLWVVEWKINHNKIPTKNKIKVCSSKVERSENVVARFEYKNKVYNDKKINEYKLQWWDDVIKNEVRIMSKEEV